MPYEPYEFSAQRYIDMSQEERQAAAATYNIDLHGLTLNQQADAIHNAALRRYSEEENARRAGLAQKAEAPGVASPEPADDTTTAPDYAIMSVDELRALAEERGVELGGAKRKTDIVELLREYDEIMAEGEQSAGEDEDRLGHTDEQNGVKKPQSGETSI